MSTGSDSISIWRVYCIEEDLDVIAYSPDIPTICPNDHADRTINPARTRKIRTISQNRVIIDEPTEGYFQKTTVELNIPAGVPNSISTHDFSWPMDLQIWNSHTIPTTEHIGDKMTIIISPNTAIGALTSTLNNGENQVNLTPQTFSLDVLSKGVEVILNDGINSQEFGRITEIDPVNYTITLEENSNFTFSPGTPFIINIKLTKDLLFDYPGKKVTIGDKGFRAKVVPAYTTIRVLYNNVSGSAKTGYFHLEYYYT